MSAPLESTWSRAWAQARADAERRPAAGPTVLLPYQGRWVASGLSGRHRLRVAEKSRRIGITWAEAARQVMIASMPASDGGCSCYYVSTSQVLGRDYIRTAATWARAMEAASPGEVLAAGEDSIQVDCIVFASGHRLEAVTSNPAALRGKGGDVVIDEAAHHLDLDELLKAASAVGKWTRFGVTVISTHNGADNPFARLVDEVRTGKRAGFLLTVDLEAAVSEGLFRRICAVSRQRWSPATEAEWLAEAFAEPGADEEYRCVASRGAGVYFRRALLEGSSRDLEVIHWQPADDHMHRPDREALTEAWISDNIDRIAAAWPDRPMVIGGDFARSADGDLSVFAVLAEELEIRRVVVALVELRGVPHADQWAVLRRLIDLAAHRLGGVRIDSGGVGNWLAEQATIYLGPTSAAGVTMSRDWKDRHFARARSDLEERRLVVPRDLDVWGDFGVVAVGPGGIPVLAAKRTRSHRDGRPRHGDAAVAIIAALAATEGDPGAIPDIGGDDDHEGVDGLPRGRSRGLVGGGRSWHGRPRQSARACVHVRRGAGEWSPAPRRSFTGRSRSGSEVVRAGPAAPLARGASPPVSGRGQDLPVTSRDGAAWKPAGLITRRSRVQVPLALSASLATLQREAVGCPG